MPGLIALWYLLGAEPCFIGFLLPLKKAGAGDAGEALAPGTGVHFSTHLRGISPSRKVCSRFRFYRRVQRCFRNICLLLSAVQRGVMVRLFCNPPPYQRWDTVCIWSWEFSKVELRFSPSLHTISSGSIIWPYLVWGPGSVPVIKESNNRRILHRLYIQGIYNERRQNIYVLPTKPTQIKMESQDLWEAGVGRTMKVS